jgi:hypothetical protein
MRTARNGRTQVHLHRISASFCPDHASLSCHIWNIANGAVASAALSVRLFRPGDACRPSTRPGSTNVADAQAQQGAILSHRHRAERKVAASLRVPAHWRQVASKIFGHRHGSRHGDIPFPRFAILGPLPHGRSGASAGRTLALLKTRMLVKGRPQPAFLAAPRRRRSKLEARLCRVTHDQPGFEAIGGVFVRPVGNSLH